MRLITVAIHTFDRALALKSILEREGIEVSLQNVNLENPTVSSGMRVRIKEHDLPLALRIIENPEVFAGLSAERSDERTILVPVDFSKHSFNAVRTAVLLADAHKASVRLLHTYIDPVVAGKMQLTDALTYELSDNDARTRIITDAARKMSELMVSVKDMMKSGQLPMVRIDHSIVEGVPEDAIAQYVKTDPPYCVVMGTRSHERKERDMIGSVTAEVLDSCRISTLVIPENATLPRTPADAKVLFFANLDQEDILAVDTMYRVFPGMTGHITIVNLPAKRRLIERSRREDAGPLAEYFNRIYPGSQFEVAEIHDNDAQAELESLCSKHQFYLLVIPNKKKSLLSRVFNPSLARKLIFNANTPMLVIPV